MRKTDVCVAGVSFKNYKSFLNRMEGSTAFSAEVLINGVQQGWVEDDGNGGCMNFSSRELQQKLAAIAATLPDQVATPQEVQMGLQADDGSPLVMKMTDELLIGQIVDRIEALSVLSRLFKSKVVFLTESNKIMQTKALPVNALQDALASNAQKIRKTWPDTRVVLNLLPMQEALDTFLANS